MFISSVCIKKYRVNHFKKSIKSLTIVKNENEAFPGIWSNYDYTIRFHKNYHVI